MKVLILGGTQFIGKAITRLCLEAGHQVTLFNRGKTPTDFNVPVIKGDINKLRESKDELRALEPDVIIHCISYTPQHGRDCVEVFGGLKTHLLVIAIHLII